MSLQADFFAATPAPDARPYESEVEAWIAAGGTEDEMEHRRRNKEDHRAVLMVVHTLQRVAELMGYRFVLNNESCPSYMLGVVLLQEQHNPERGYYVHAELTSPKKLRISGMARDLQSFFEIDDNQNNSIGVSWQRSPEAIVKEIYTRLHPRYREICARAEVRRQAFEREGAQLRALITQAVQAAGPTAQGSVMKQNGCHEATMHAGRWNATSVRAQASLYNGEKFKLTFDSVPPELALQLLRIFGEYHS